MPNLDTPIVVDQTSTTMEIRSGLVLVPAVQELELVLPSLESLVDPRFQEIVEPWIVPGAQVYLGEILVVVALEVTAANVIDEASVEEDVITLHQTVKLAAFVITGAVVAALVTSIATAGGEARTAIDHP